MSDMTARLELPLIVPGQAAKELTHNEALALLAMLVQPVVFAVDLDTPPTAPVEGQAWIVGGAPNGEWAGHAHAIAGWTEGGWRFVAATEGMAAWVGPAAVEARFVAGGWTVGAMRASRLLIDGNPSIGSPRAAPMAPTGGQTIDAEARGSIAAILTVLRYHGLIA